MQATDRSDPVPDFGQGKRSEICYGLTKGVVNQRASSHLGDVGRRPSTSQVGQGGAPGPGSLETKVWSRGTEERDRDGGRDEERPLSSLSCRGRGALHPRQPIPIALDQVVSSVECRFRKRHRSGYGAGLAAHRCKRRLNLKVCLHFHVSAQARQPRDGKRSRCRCSGTFHPP